MTDITADPHESEYEDLEVPDDEDCASGGGGDSITNKKQTRWRKIVKEGLVVPYRHVHDPPCSFKTPNRCCFIPGRPVFAKILSVERGSMSTHLLNPNLYVIQLHHGPYVWTIKRRYKHFHHLHQQLQLFRLTMIVPMPTRTHKERRSNYKTSMLQMPKDETGKTTRGLPRFPKRPEAMVASDQLEERRKALEQYLQDLLKIRAFRNHHETTEFLEVSTLSFIQGLGDKGKEGMVQKRTGTTHTRRCTFRLCSCLSASCLRIQHCCGDCCGHWQQRWLIARETFVAYVRPKDGLLHCVMLVDPEFEASMGRYEGGISNGIVLSNLSRELLIKCWTKRKAKEWLDCCRQISNSESAKAFIGPNRFTSYAPVRKGVEADWFVDGGSYMNAIADVLQSATEEILISDWWLSPEIYMKRPSVDGERWRLDKILQRKAHEGVKIFVLLYKEVNLALGINSFYSKQKLVAQHPENIKVLRHPDHVSAGVFLWAHHEKLVIVDQSIAFVGGIDLCYGRWDTNEHKLTDLGSISAARKPLGYFQKTITSSNVGGGEMPSSILQLAKVTTAMTVTPLFNHAEAKALQRSLPPDVLVKENKNVEKDEGESAHVTFAGIVPEGEEYEMEEQVEPSFEHSELEPNGAVPLKGETPPTRRKLIRRVTQVTREIREATRDLKDDGKEWVSRHLRRRESKDGRTGSGTDTEEERDVQHLDDSSVREPRAEVRRTSHIVGDTPFLAEDTDQCPIDKEANGSVPQVQLQGCAKLWLGKDYTNFIVKDFSDLESPFTDLVDRSTTPRMPWHDIGVMVQGTAARDVARHFIQRWNAVKDEKVPLNPSYPFLLPKAYDDKCDTYFPCVTTSQKYKVSCQVVRSLSAWSGGIRMIEESIQQAYIELIEDAQHYIYMENQFFISLAASNAQVQNRIGEALLARILRAHREKKTFRVFVIIPLLPGFEGEVGTSRGIAIHAITHWNYASISRGSDSLMGRLQAAGIEDVSQYVTFHGLRTYSQLHEDPVTELIYVHSKLLIIDDRTMICGSANINDRSLLGKRDSEVCVVIQDETFVDSTMNGKEYQAGQFVQSIRLSLFREHLGISVEEEINLEDPVSEDFYRNVWIQTAVTNTETYDFVFHCVPTDNCVNFLHLHEYQREHPIAVTDPITATNLLKVKVKGHLVLLPLQFLRDENLLPAAGTKEALMPTNLWT